MRQFTATPFEDIQQSMRRGLEQSARGTVVPASRWSVPEIPREDHHRDERHAATRGRSGGHGEREADWGRGPGWNGPGRAL